MIFLLILGFKLNYVYLLFFAIGYMFLLLLVLSLERSINILYNFCERKNIINKNFIQGESNMSL